jgi:hypothetical protein
MDIANKFADGEDTYHNKRTHSPEDDRSHCYSNQKRMPRNYEGYSSHSQVAAGYRDNNDNQGDEHRRGATAMTTWMIQAPASLSGQEHRETIISHPEIF